jgi:hypothetical protein
MMAHESSTPYTQPLQSGSFPMVTARTSGGQLLRAAGGWLSLVVAAASAGYWCTLWSMTSQTVRAADVEHVNPQLMAAESALAEVSRQSADEQGASSASAARAAEALAAASMRQPAPLPKRRHAITLVANTATRPGPWSAPAELGPPPEAVSAPQQPHDLPELPILPVAAQQPLSVRPPRSTLSLPVRNLQPPETRTPPVGTLAAQVSIHGLVVRGSLPTAAVRRALERVQPELAACYAHSARAASRNQFGRVQLHVVFDERGRARAPSVSGGGLPGLEPCIGNVAQKLVTSSPDTGVVDAALRITFGPL